MKKTAANLEVFAIGTKVKMLDNIDGVIRRVQIEPTNLVSYEISRWVGNSRQLEWFYDYEFTIVDSHQKIKIGFKH